MCHYLPHNHRNTFGKSLTSLCLAKLTKNRFLTAATATLALGVNRHDFSWHTACCFAHVFWVKNKRKKRKNILKITSLHTPPLHWHREASGRWPALKLVKYKKGQVVSRQSKLQGHFSQTFTVFWYSNHPLLAEHIKFAALTVHYH